MIWNLHLYDTKKEWDGNPVHRYLLTKSEGVKEENIVVLLLKEKNKDMAEKICALLNQSKESTP